MANLQERRDKEGKLISYSIRVHRGRDASGRQLKPFTCSFRVKTTWSEKTARKRAEAFAAQFEKECREKGTNDNRVKFEDYLKYVIDLREERGLKHRTIQTYRNLSHRINDAIGHIKVKDLRPEHLNRFYTDLGKAGTNKRTGNGLSPKFIREHHNLIHLALDMAVKENIVPYNVADRVILPRAEKKEIEYFEPETIIAIREALNTEPIRWNMLTHLYLVTGCRRGEILGLRWKDVDFDSNQIHVCRNILYTPQKGIYESSPKTDKSIRWVSLPKETMNLLRKYRAWQAERRLQLADYYQDNDYVFSQDTGHPLHPDSVTDWMNKFSKRHNLPHLNPHKLRHSQASLLIYSGVDAVTVAKRLGHSQTSTTLNTYSHAFEEADRRSADVIAEIILRNGTSENC